MRVESFLKNLCVRLCQKDIDGLVGQFSLPIPIYHPDGIKFIATRDQAYATMSIILKGMDAIGAATVDYTLAKLIERPVNASLACRAIFHYRDANGVMLRETTVCYFFDTHGSDLKVTMVEYEVPAFREAVMERTA